MDLEESAPYLRHFLDLPAGSDRVALLTPEAVKLRTFLLLRQVSLASSQQRPLLMVVENLHWIDPSSEDYLVSLVEVLAGARLLLLVTFRPGYRPPWMEKSYATQITLPRLTSQDSLTVVRVVLSQAHFPYETTQRILDKAEGNPFFLEELAQAVHEHGALHSDVPIPDTIQGVLMARIDRLSEETKRVVQTAAVLGRTASVRLLETVWAASDTLALHLQELQRLELLYEQRGGTEPAYVFKHALTQEVAYGSLLQEQRQVLHQTAGEALETLYADHLEAVYDRLAYHYARTARADKAVEYLTHLAEQAQREYAHAEAVTILQEACAQVEELSAEMRDQSAIKLVVLQAESLHALGRMRDGVDLLRQEQDRLERLQNPVLAGPYYFWLSLLYCNLGEHEPASQSAQHALAAARQCDDEVTMGKTCYVLSRESIAGGQYRQGVAYGKEGVTLLEKTAEQYWLGMAYVVQASSYTYLGELEPALQAAEHASTLGEAIEHRTLQSRALSGIARCYSQMKAWEAAITACRGAIASAPDAVCRITALRQLGDIYVYQGDHARAIPVLEEAVRQAEQSGHSLLHSNSMAILSEAYLLSGDIEKARVLAGQALNIGRDARYWIVVALALRALGLVAQAEGDVAEAKRYFTEALQVFATSNALHQVGRVHTRLASLVYAQGQPEAAATHLKEAHALFTRLCLSRDVENTEQLARDLGIELFS
jgi:tetratricopeptide (TPR) repeat protein